MATFQLPLEQIQAFFLIFLRVSAVMFTAPIVGSKTVPGTVKAGLSLALVFALFPAIYRTEFVTFPNSMIWLVGAVGELMLGIAIGLTVRLMFAGIQMAGQISGYQMGLAIANIMDPATSAQIPILAQIYNLIAMLLFVTFDAHHWFIRGLVESYALIPPLEAGFNGAGAMLLTDLAGGMFVVAIKVGAPVIVVLLVTSVAFGLLARTVPQMNVFIVAMPLKIAVGLLFVGMSLPFLMTFLKHLFGRWPEDLMTLLKIMGT